MPNYQNGSEKAHYFPPPPGAADENDDEAPQYQQYPPPLSSPAYPPVASQSPLSSNTYAAPTDKSTYAAPAERHPYALPVRSNSKSDAPLPMSPGYAPPMSPGYAPPMSPGYVTSPSPAQSSQATLSSGRRESMTGGAPPASQFTGQHNVDDVGQFNGGAYRISHRDTNTIVTVQLAIGAPLHVKSGAMIAMSPTVTVKGEIKFSVKKLIAGGHITMSHFTGPGEVLLAPHGLGDIATLRLSGSESWNVGKDSFLACTERVVKDYKAQNLSKMMFSGEGWFTYRISGTGILWFCSLGAIIRKDIPAGEKYIIDNGHLVAWNCDYVIERVASGGIVSGLAAGEGLVCKFTGPGTVFMQTRNATALSAFLTGQQTHGI